MKLRRFTAIILAVILSLGMITVSVFAESEREFLYYEDFEGTKLRDGTDWAFNGRGSAIFNTKPTTMIVSAGTGADAADNFFTKGIIEREGGKRYFASKVISGSNTLKTMFPFTNVWNSTNYPNTKLVTSYIYRFNDISNLSYGSAMRFYSYTGAANARIEEHTGVFTYNGTNKQISMSDTNAAGSPTSVQLGADLEGKDILFTVVSEYVDGVIKHKKYANGVELLVPKESVPNFAQIDCIVFENSAAGYELDDLMVYTIPADKPDAFALAEKHGQTITNLSQNDVLEVEINGYVDPGTLSCVNLYEQIGGGERTLLNANDYTKKVSFDIDPEEGTITSLITIKKNGKLSLGAQYDVALYNPSNTSQTLMSSTGTQLANASSAEVSFQTISKPSFTLSEGAGWSFTATNTTNREALATVMIAAYDASDNIIAYAYMESEYATAASDTFTCSFDVPTNAISVKAFVCEGLESIDSVFSNVITVQ